MKVLATIKFQTDTQPISTITSGLLYIPMSFITRKVGINPPLKNIVMTKNILIAAFPGNFGLEREYAAVNVTIILMTTLDIV